MPKVYYCPRKLILIQNYYTVQLEIRNLDHIFNFIRNKHVKEYRPYESITQNVDFVSRLPVISLVKFN